MTRPRGLAETTVDGLRLRYADLGRGEPVVLLHGYSQSHLAWRRQVDALAAKWRVIALDWFGWGESERDPTRSCRYADEVDRLGRALDALGLDRFNLIAHDYGGLLALGYAPGAGPRLLRLGVIASRAHADFLLPYRSLLRVQAALCRWSPRLAQALPWRRIVELSSRVHVRQGCFDAAILGEYLGWLDTPPGRRWWVRYHADYRLEAMPELLEGVAGLTCPTMVLWGRADRYVAPAVGRELAKGLPDARWVLVPGADHFVMEERPAEVLRNLEALLETPLTMDASRAAPRRMASGESEA